MFKKKAHREEEEKQRVGKDGFFSPGSEYSGVRTLIRLHADTHTIRT
jgi:hypothetical protein